MSESLKIFEGKKLFQEGGRAVHYYTFYLMVLPYSRIGKWGQISGVVGRMKDHICKWDIVVNDPADFIKFYSDYEADKEHDQKIKNHIDECCDKTLQRLQDTNLSEISNEELADVTKFFYDQGAEQAYIPGYLRAVDRGIRYLIETKYSAAVNGNDFLQHAPAGTKLSFIAEEERAVLETALKIKQENIATESEAHKALIQDLFNRFRWSGMGYFTEPVKTIEFYSNAIDEALTKGPENRLSEIAEHQNFILNERQKFLQPLNAELQRMAEIAAASTYLKDYYKAHINRMILEAESLFDEISARSGRSKNFLKDLLPEETEELILHSKVDEAYINNRTQCSVVLSCLPKPVILTGGEAIAYEEKFFGEVTIQQEYKGRVASRGYAKGRVKVILGHEQFGKFEKGDILVVTNTSPDFVAIMGKAAAIIAEEGGITAHVSVVSREMKIPCVVGINRAPELFKDGDMVEVDAEKGLVRKV